MKTRLGLTTLAWMLALLTGPALAQQIYKWTDANGQVHFSDQPPPGQARADVVGNLPKSPRPPPAPASPEPRKTGDLQPQDVYPGTPEFEARERERGERILAEQERERAAQEKRIKDLAASQEQSQRKADEALVARCKSNHEVYCDQGAAEIRRAELEKAWHFYDMDKAAQRAQELRPPGQRGERIRAVPPSEPRPPPAQTQSSQLYEKQKNRNKKPQ